jgi:hypothetical protein
VGCDRRATTPVDVGTKVGFRGSIAEESSVGDRTMSVAAKGRGMIVTEAADRYRFVTQPDHAALSGQLAARWGTGTRFARPEPWHAVCIAATHHDQGWAEYDMAPRLDDGEVIDFIGVPAASWTTFYAEGVTAVAAVDRYAGLLASMHAAGLRRSAYGSRPGIPDRSSDSRFEALIDEQEAFQRQVAEELADSERYGEYVGESERDFLDALHETGSIGEAAGSIGKRSRLGEGYLLLQLFDTLSLQLCRSVALGPTEIGPVPTGNGGTAALDVSPVGPAAIRVKPYPFDASPLSVSVGARVVPVRESERDLAAAYHEAERRSVEFAIHE